MKKRKLKEEIKWLKEALEIATNNSFELLRVIAGKDEEIEALKSELKCKRRDLANAIAGYSSVIKTWKP